MHIKPARSIPPVLQRAFDAFRDNDAVSIAESFASDAQLSMEMDRQLADTIGLHGIDSPILASGAVGIRQLYALEFAYFDVKELEVFAHSEVSQSFQTVCRWTIRVRQSGALVDGICHNRWILDPTGSRIVDGKTFCGMLPAKRP